MTELIALLLGSTLLAFICGYVYRWRGVPFLGRWRHPFVGHARCYAIGIRSCSSLRDLAGDTTMTDPVLSASAVTDVLASFVSDPFVLLHKDKWFMFMEVFNRRRGCGEIGLAISDNGCKWSYQSVVLREPFHLSYPNVFEFQSDIWMVPETGKDHSVRLYRAVDFPTKWRLEKCLIEGSTFVDPTVFHYAGSWWMFVSRNRSEDLLLYCADELTGPWFPHPQLPIIYNRSDKARCAGRPFQANGELIRFAQDCGKEYGQSVRAFRVDRLNRMEYRESELYESPLIRGAQNGWNAGGMHHIDLCPWPGGCYMAVVDGWCVVRTIGLKF